MTNDHDIMMMTNEGIMIRMHCSDITVIGRITSGVKLMNIGKDGNTFVASVAKLARSDEDEEAEDSENPESAENEVSENVENDTENDAESNSEE